MRITRQQAELMAPHLKRAIDLLYQAHTQMEAIEEIAGASFRDRTSVMTECMYQTYTEYGDHSPEGIMRLFEYLHGEMGGNLYDPMFLDCEKIAVLLD